MEDTTRHGLWCHASERLGRIARVFADGVSVGLHKGGCDSITSRVLEVTLTLESGAGFSRLTRPAR